MNSKAEREQIFTRIHDEHIWGGVSKSGTGSDISQTGVVRAELPKLLKRLGVTSILDIPCGDLHWISRVVFDPNMKYIGADIVPRLIEENRQRNIPNAEFEVLDIVVDLLPRTDLVFVRDLFGHLADDEIQKALNNVRVSGAEYLVATTFPRITKNTDIMTGGWRRINMDLYGLKAVMYMDEKLGDEGKMLGVYRLR